MIENFPIIPAMAAECSAVAYDVLTTGAGGLTAVLAGARLAVGVFFAISGYHKLVNAGGRGDTVRDLFTHLHLPFPRVLRWFVPGVELAAGVGLTVGLLTVPAAVALLAICLVACLTDGMERVRSSPTINRADWLDTVLYLPEVQLAIILLVAVSAGPDAWTLDALLFWR